jgi:hypothetical protein
MSKRSGVSFEGSLRLVPSSPASEERPDIARPRSADHQPVIREENMRTKHGVNVLPTLALIAALGACGSGPTSAPEEKASALVSIQGESGAPVKVTIACGDVEQTKTVSVRDRGNQGPLADAYFKSLPAPASCTADVVVLNRDGTPATNCAPASVEFHTTPGSVELVSASTLCRAQSGAGANVVVHVDTGDALVTPDFEDKWAAVCGWVDLQFEVVKNNDDPYELTLAPSGAVATGLVRIIKAGDGFRVQCLAARPDNDGSVPLRAGLRQYGQEVASMDFSIHCYDAKTSPAPGQQCDNGAPGSCLATGQFECSPINDSVVCNAPPAPVETCDGQDNDCDGKVDEGCCGNGALDVGEACDGTNLGGKTCGSLGFSGGTLACNSTCTLNTNHCVNSCASYSSVERATDCNQFHDGTPDDYSACMADRSGGCADAEQEAWCRRRFDESHTSWYNYNRDWVQARCAGEVRLVRGSSTYGGKDYFFCQEEYPSCTRIAGVTPIVIVDNDARLGFRPAVSGSKFDLDSSGIPATYDVPVNAAWLVRPDPDGQVRGGWNLFGSGSKTAAGRPANGFVALRELADSNADGFIDNAEASSLMLWRDLDANWVATANELTSIRTLGTVSIDLAYSSNIQECDDGNCAVERSAITYTTPDGVVRTAPVVDVHLLAR